MTQRQISALAEGQLGIVARPQLQAAGVSTKQIRVLVRRGFLIALHTDVYAVGHGRLVPRARLLAAQLTCGEGAFLSHRTAAAVWGLRAINVHHVEVTVISTRARRRPGLSVHRTFPAPVDVCTRDGLQVSTVSRLLVELAARETLTELQRLITQGIRKRVLRLPDMEEALCRYAHRPGLVKLKHALRDYRPRPDSASGLERLFDELIVGTDVPAPLCNVTIDGWEVDRYWPDHRLVVELDGRPYHVAVRDMEKDKYKDTKLLRRGIDVMRVTDLWLALEPQAVLDDVRALTTSARRRTRAT